MKRTNNKNEEFATMLKVLFGRIERENVKTNLNTIELIVLIIVYFTF